MAKKPPEDPILNKDNEIGRPLTKTEVATLEGARTLRMLSPFEKSFLDDFETRYAKFGLSTNVFPKQAKIIKELKDRLAKAGR